MTKRTAATAAVLVAVTSLAGCAPGADDNQASRTSSASPTSAGMAVAQAKQIMADYDRRNNAAIAAQNPPRYDDSSWASADTEGVLAADIHATRVRKFDKVTGAGEGSLHRVVGVYGGAPRSDDGQGPWSLVVASPDLSLPGASTRATSSAASATSSASTTPPAKRDKPSAIVAAMVPRTGAPQQWMLFAHLAIPASVKLPQPMPAGATTTLTRPQRQAVANMIPDVIMAIRTGTFDGLKDAGGELQKVRDAVTPADSKADADQWIYAPICRPFGAARSLDVETAPIVGTPAIRLVRVHGGSTLGVLSLDCDVSFEAKDGGEVKLDPAWAKAEGDDGKPKAKLTRRVVTQLLISTPDKGTPVVLATSTGLAVPDKR